MKGNEGKCPVIISTDETDEVNVGTFHINNSKYEKLLGIKIDCKLKSDDHIGNTSKKAGAKFNALTRVAQYMNTEEKRLIMNAFFSSQFSYWPLILDVPRQVVNHEINRLYERCLLVLFIIKVIHPRWIIKSRQFSVNTPKEFTDFSKWALYKFIPIGF